MGGQDRLMGRRAKPVKGKVEAKRPLAGKSPKNEGAGFLDLEKRLAEAVKLKTEAQEQQAATAEILRVISRSPTDVQPVFEVVLTNGVRLCRASFGGVFRFDGELIHLVTSHEWPPEQLEAVHRRFPMPPGDGSLAARAIRDCHVVQTPDYVADSQAGTLPEWVPGGEQRPRSTIAIPMLRDGNPIGAIVLARAEAGLFSDQHIALLKTFADQAVITIENVRLFNETKEALEQQTATAEILRVISSSPTDVQPVFDAIAHQAMRLCDGSYSVIGRYDGELLHLVAHQHVGAEGVEAVTRRFPMRPSRATTSSRAILARAVVHVPDVLDDLDYDQSVARGLQNRSTLAVPMLLDGEPIGSISVGRLEPRPFTDKQIALLQIFADQAVIAIENVRLFTELEDKNRALTDAHAQVTEALEQQTATAEILRVISSSPTDVQPVLDTVAENVARLCEAEDVSIFEEDGGVFHVLAARGTDHSRFEGTPVSRDSVTGRAIIGCQFVHVHDIAEAPDFPVSQAYAQLSGNRTMLAMPLLRQGASIGAIFVRRTEVRPFSAKQIDLLQTFADQAVIAIENVRLFTELQASNRELTTALDTQTATSDILRVISRSQTDVQPVFDAILASAVRLLRAQVGGVTRVVDDRIELAAVTSTHKDGDAVLRNRFPQSLDSGGAHARAIRGRTAITIVDAQNDPSVTEAGRAIARMIGYHTMAAVPMFRDDTVIGTISVNRLEPGGFTDDEITLLQTFADQAVIAIENARLFSELQARTAELTRSVDELTALGDVGRVLSSTLDLETVLQTIVTRANQLTGTAGCTIWEYDEAREEFRLRASHYADEADTAMLQAPGRVTTIPKGQGVTTRVMEQRQPVQIHDITNARDYESPIRRPLIEAGHRALLGVPLLSEDEVIGVLAVTRKTPGEFEPEIVGLLSTFATQSALAIQNARLFLEIEDKSRQLEAASQHKSEFLANMSHELRTPLNAIIGFSEVLADAMFGEVNEKQAEYLGDIQESGRHLLSLINDILDLSKIEAGRMELEPTDFDLPGAIDNALTLVRERASRRGITLGRAIDERVGTIRADERKVKQVLLNLLSNALKFTPEGGRIDVSANVNDNLVEVAVADTGVGIAPEDQEAVFEEFRQVGTADKKVEGTGLGLALSRKFIELHGGRIGVKSEVGQGSTFTFTLPVRRGA
jgi:two-component system, NtrC family, sensor kinase